MWGIPENVPVYSRETCQTARERNDQTCRMADEDAVDDFFATSAPPMEAAGTCVTAKDIQMMSVKSSARFEFFLSLVAGDDKILILSRSFRTRITVEAYVGGWRGCRDHEMEGFLW